jgi:hypothetical protein
MRQLRLEAVLKHFDLEIHLRLDAQHQRVIIVRGRDAIS